MRDNNLKLIHCSLELSLTVVHEEELVGAREALDGDDVGGAWAIDTHGRCGLVAAIDASELVSGPDTEDGADGEVGVDDAGAIKGVESDAESLAAHVLEDGLFLGARVLADVRVAQGLEQELVGEHVHGELLIAEGVDAGGGAARRGAHLEGDGSESLAHAHQQPRQALVGRGLAQEYLQAVTQLCAGQCLPAAARSRHHGARGRGHVRAVQRASLSSLHNSYHEPRASPHSQIR